MDLNKVGAYQRILEAEEEERGIIACVKVAGAAKLIEIKVNKLDLKVFVEKYLSKFDQDLNSDLGNLRCIMKC